MMLYVLALNRGIQKIIPEVCSIIGCGFLTIPARQIGQIVSVNWTQDFGGSMNGGTIKFVGLLNCQTIDPSNYRSDPMQSVPTFLYNQ